MRPRGETTIQKDELDLLDRRLVRNRNQSVGTFAHRLPELIDKPSEQKANDRSQILLYDFDLDKTVELSPLALWALQGLEGSCRPSKLLEHL